LFKEFDMRSFWNLARLAATMALLLSGLTPSLAADNPPPAVPSIAAGGVSYERPYNCGGGVFGMLSSLNAPIPDATGEGPGLLTDQLLVSTPGVFVWTVTVSVTIDHDWNEDLDIFLVSPAGTRVTLTTDNGGTQEDDFYGRLFIDKAGELYQPGPITLADYDEGQPLPPVAPEEPFGAFRGENPNGVWRLEVYDDEELIDGTLHRWQLNIDYLAHAPALRYQQRQDFTATPIPDTGVPVTRTFTFDSEPYSALGTLNLYTLIDHPRASDLVLELLTPAGEIITLSDHQGGDNADIFDGTFWADTAGGANPPGAVTDAEVISGTAETYLAPQEPLGAATGVNVGAGEWRFVVRDTVPGQSGALNEASLNVWSLACLPDLELTVDRPDWARMDEPAPVKISVENVGGNTLAPVYVTATLPVSTSLHSLVAPDWTCSGVSVGQFGGTLTCSTANLAGGDESTVLVRLNPPALPAKVGNLQVQANTLDAFDGALSQPATLRFTAHSANGQPWDVSDLSANPGDDTGDVLSGGQGTFNGFGRLRLSVFDGMGTPLASTDTDGLRPFGLVAEPGGYWRTTTPTTTAGVQTSRALYAPPTTNWLRYVDTFTNTSGDDRTVWVGWGGQLGSGNGTLLVANSSPDENLTATDTWGVTSEDSFGEAFDPPVGYILRSPSDTTYQGPGIYAFDPFTDTWASPGDPSLAHVYRLDLAPGESASLAYFLYRGLAEDETGPADCDYYEDCLPEPDDGSQVDDAIDTAEALAAEPDFCDLSDEQTALIVNWPGASCEVAVYLPLVVK
jgi:subtilisin-like proprotein convertase family protein